MELSYLCHYKLKVLISIPSIGSEAQLHDSVHRLSRRFHLEPGMYEILLYHDESNVGSLLWKFGIAERWIGYRDLTSNPINIIRSAKGIALRAYLVVCMNSLRARTSQKHYLWGFLVDTAVDTGIWPAVWDWSMLCPSSGFGRCQRWPTMEETLQKRYEGNILVDERVPPYPFR